MNTLRSKCMIPCARLGHFRILFRALQVACQYYTDVRHSTSSYVLTFTKHQRLSFELGPLGFD